MGIPAILSGILTQLALYSINLGIMSNKANTAVNANKYDLLVSLRNVRNFSLDNPILLLLIITAAVIALLYWFFGTEYGCALRATGANVNMARAQGINTGRAKVVGLMLSNGLVALSGALLTQYQAWLRENGVQDSQIVSENFEELEYEELLDYKKLYTYLKERLVVGKTTYIFLDEIQKVAAFEKVVDSMYVKPDVDIYITGSLSLIHI